MVEYPPGRLGLYAFSSLILTVAVAALNCGGCRANAESEMPWKTVLAFHRVLTGVVAQSGLNCRFTQIVDIPASGARPFYNSSNSATAYPSWLFTATSDDFGNELFETAVLEIELRPKGASQHKERISSFHGCQVCIKEKGCYSGGKGKASTADLLRLLKAATQ